MIFDLWGAHTGDLLLALPVAQAAKNAGQDVAFRIEPRYYSPARWFGIPNVSGHKQRVYPYIGHGRHRTDDWLARMRRRGLDLTPAKAQFCGQARKDLLPDRGWVLLQPWCEDGGKTWMLPNWIDLSERLESLGYKVATGGPEFFRETASYIKGKNLCGRDSGDWIRTIAAADMVVSVDSGAAHAADALGVPCISLYSDHMPAHVWSPFWDDSKMIVARHMNDITVNDVLERL